MAARSIAVSQCEDIVSLCPHTAVSQCEDIVSLCNTVGYRRMAGGVMRVCTIVHGIANNHMWSLATGMLYH